METELTLYPIDGMNEIFISDENEKKELYDGFKNVIELLFEDNDEDYNFGDIHYEKNEDNQVFYQEIVEAVLFTVIKSIYGDKFDDINKEGFHVVVDMNENLLKVNELDKVYVSYLKVAYMYGLHATFNVLTSEQTPIHEKHETINFHLDELNLSGKKKKKKDKKKKKKNK